MKNLTCYALVFIPLFAACFWMVDARGSITDLSKIDELVYIGTYTGPKSQGIYVYRLSAATGKLTPLGLAAESNNPGYLAIDPTHRYLYAVNEIADYEGKKSGSVSAFSINHKTGKLTLLNIVASGGSGPTHLVVDKTGKYVLVANYGAGSVGLFPILADGRLGQARAILPQTGHSVNPQRQEAAARAFHLRIAGQSFCGFRRFGNRSGVHLPLRREQRNADAQPAALRHGRRRQRPPPLRV